MGNGCRTYQRVLASAPLPFAHRLIEVMARSRTRGPDGPADKEVRRILAAAEWSDRQVDRVVEAWQAQPVAVRRAIAGSAWEAPIGSEPLARMLLASATENAVVALNAAARREARERLAGDPGLRRSPVDIVEQAAEAQAARRHREAGRDAADGGARNAGRRGRPVTIVNQEGGLVVVDVDDDGLVTGPSEQTPEDPAKRVAWTLVAGTCAEPVFSTDHVLGIGQFHDGRGRRGVRLLRRASGLPYRFEEGDEVAINKTLYGPADPNGFLEVDVDLLEIDSPKDVLDAIESFIEAAEDVGDILKNPTVTLSTHLARIVFALIESIVDDDGIDLGNISPRTYTPQSRIDSEAGQERDHPLSRSAVFGYDWDYTFDYLLQKTG